MSYIKLNKMSKERVSELEVVGMCDQSFELKEAVEEIQRLRHVMKAVASMAGKDWFICQLALAEALDGEGDNNINWVLSAYESLQKENKK